jgi:DNA-directed RNA polymerase subunit RPC12/RpoP
MTRFTCKLSESSACSTSYASWSCSCLSPVAKIVLYTRCQKHRDVLQTPLSLNLQSCEWHGTTYSVSQSVSLKLFIQVLQYYFMGARWPHTTRISAIWCDNCRFRILIRSRYKNIKKFNIVKTIIMIWVYRVRHNMMRPIWTLYKWSRIGTISPPPPHHNTFLIDW